MALELELLIAQKLLQIKAIKLSPQNPFTWASGIKSPIYCDNRITLSHPEVRTMIKQGFVNMAKDFGQIDMIAGVATAGIAHGALMADAMNLPFCYVRSSPKTHGRQNQIEGEVMAGSRILVIEDLISTGGSSIEVVEILRQAGCEVLAVGAIFDYGFEKARQNFLKNSCNFFSLSRYDVLVKEAARSGYVTMEQQNILESWNHDPESWYSNNF